MTVKKGQRGYGSVETGVWSHTPVVVKTIKIWFCIRCTCRELVAMQKVHHLHVVLVMAYVIDGTDCHIVMHLVSVNLRKMISQKVNNKIVIQVWMAVVFVRNLNPKIIHCDLKRKYSNK